MRTSLSYAVAAAAFAILASEVQAQNVLSPSDFIIAIDNNRNLPGNTNTGVEGPASAFDENNANKWFSAARQFGGLIITPAGGSAQVQSLSFTTGNDASNRDPVNFQLFGTNVPVTTVDNGTGLENAWTLIGSGATGIAPSSVIATARSTTVGPINVTNPNSYSAYKIVFPTLRSGNDAANTPADPAGIQVSEVRMFNQPGGGGVNVAAMPTLVVALDQTDSRFPVNENPTRVLDNNTATKYLNFGREGTGLIITPAAGPTTVGSFQITTANDAPGRDPTQYELYGTNNTVTSLENSEGNSETWALISSGPLSLPGDPLVNTDQRLVNGPVVGFANATSYKSYKFIFPENKSDAGNGNSIQFSEIKLFAVPEPSSAAVLGLAALGVLRRRRGA
jgi:hypothetical protein